MAANQLFKGLQLATLRLGNQFSVQVLEYVGEIHSALATDRSGDCLRKMQFIFLKDRRGRKIRFDSESHLEGVREIIESGYHHAFQNLFFGETNGLKVDDVFTRKLLSSRSQFDSEVQQSLVGHREVGFMMVHGDLVTLLRGHT